MGTKFILFDNFKPVEVDPEGFFRVIRSLAYLFQYDDDIEFNWEEHSIDFCYWEDEDNNHEVRRCMGRIIFY